MRVIEVAGLCYSVAATMFFGVVYVSSCVWGALFESVPRTAIVGVGAVHAAALVVAFQPRHLEPWKPVLKGTSARLRMAKWMLWALLGLVGVHLGLVLAAGGRDEQTRAWAYGSLLSAMLLASAGYLVMHWSYRPDAFVPPALRVLANPLSPALGLLLRKARRKVSRRNARAGQTRRHK